MYTINCQKKSNTRSRRDVHRSLHRIYTQFTPLKIKYQRNSIEICVLCNLTHWMVLLINFGRIHLCQKQSVSFGSSDTYTHKKKRMKLISTKWYLVFLFCLFFHFIFEKKNVLCVTCNRIRIVTFDFQFVNCCFEQYNASGCLRVSACKCVRVSYCFGYNPVQEQQNESKQCSQAQNWLIPHNLANKTRRRQLSNSI